MRETEGLMFQTCHTTGNSPLLRPMYKLEALMLSHVQIIVKTTY